MRYGGVYRRPPQVQFRKAVCVAALAAAAPAPPVPYAAIAPRPDLAPQWHAYKQPQRTRYRVAIYEVPVAAAPFPFHALGGPDRRATYVRLPRAIPAPGVGPPVALYLYFPPAERAVVSWTRDETAVLDRRFRRLPAPVQFNLPAHVVAPPPPFPFVAALGPPDRVATHIRRREAIRPSTTGPPLALYQYFPPGERAIVVQGTVDRVATFRRPTRPPPPPPTASLATYVPPTPPTWSIAALARPDKTATQRRRPRDRARVLVAIYEVPVTPAPPGEAAIIAAYRDDWTPRYKAYRRRMHVGIQDAVRVAFYDGTAVATPAAWLRGEDRTPFIRRRARIPAGPGVPLALYVPPSLPPAEPAIVSWRRDETATLRRLPFRLPVGAPGTPLAIYPYFPPAEQAVVTWTRDQTATQWRVPRRLPVGGVGLPLALYVPPSFPPAEPAIVAAAGWRDWTSKYREYRRRMHLGVQDERVLGFHDGTALPTLPIVVWRRDATAPLLRPWRPLPVGAVAPPLALYVPVPPPAAEPAIVSWKRDTTATLLRLPFRLPIGAIGPPLGLYTAPPAPPAEPAIVGWKRDETAVLLRLPRRLPIGAIGPALALYIPVPPPPAEPAIVSWKRDTTATFLRLPRRIPVGAIGPPLALYVVPVVVAPYPAYERRAELASIRRVRWVVQRLQETAFPFVVLVPPRPGQLVANIEIRPRIALDGNVMLQGRLDADLTIDEA